MKQSVLVQDTNIGNLIDSNPKQEKHSLINTKQNCGISFGAIDLKMSEALVIFPIAQLYINQRLSVYFNIATSMGFRLFS